MCLTTLNYTVKSVSNNKWFFRNGLACVQRPTRKIENLLTSNSVTYNGPRYSFYSSFFVLQFPLHHTFLVVPQYIYFLVLHICYNYFCYAMLAVKGCYGCLLFVIPSATIYYHASIFPCSWYTVLLTPGSRKPQKAVGRLFLNGCDST